jgi:ribonuclease HII
MDKSEYIPIEIVDDSSDEEFELKPTKNTKLTNSESLQPKIIKSRLKAPQNLLKKFYNEDENIFEIGVDEAGRGPLFGRVYTASVILPKDDSFNHSLVKDSKKFHSKKKIEEVAKYIKENAIAWYVSFEDEKTIDEINILQATQSAMHSSIHEIRKQFNKKQFDQFKIERKDYSYHLLIDGNYFNPITVLNKNTNKMEIIPYITIEGGDNKYTAIAAASILAKVERDKYIDELCEKNPTLSEFYGIDSNKGYGAKRHIDGIKEHGITIWHRRSFGICKNYV